MNSEKVSIVVPVYNAEKYLKECVDSLIKQDYDNIEIILVDDGSTDNSPQICDEYRKKDERVKVIHKKNAGVSAARNDGIKNSTGEWVTFVDADDWVEKNYVSSMYECVDNTTSLVIGRTIANNNGVYLDDGYKGKEIEIFVGERKKMLFQSIFNDYVKMIKFPHISTCSAKLIKKDVIIDNSICYDQDLKYYEDAIFNIEIICLANKVKLINKKIYMYRYNIDSSTNTFSDDTISMYENVYKKISKIEKKYDLDFSNYNDIFKIKNLNTILVNYVKSVNDRRLAINFIKNICNSLTYSKSIKNVNIKNLPKRRKVLVVLCRMRLYNLIFNIYRI